MIDLSHTRARLLAEIEASGLAGPLRDITDPRVATTDAHVRVCGHGRDDLFPLLKNVLSERFVAVPRAQLIRDLLVPLRNALGNAYKHGNGRDPAKAVSLEVTLTRKGALLAISDEGSGFDVALTLRRFQEQQSYFVNHGCGFRNLHRARSTVSYENGGRTLLLCFRPAIQDADPAAAGACDDDAREVTFPASARRRRDQSSAEFHSAVSQNCILPSVAARDAQQKSNAPPIANRRYSRLKICATTATNPPGDSLPKALDEEWIKTSLSAELPEFASGQARLESCRIYETRGPAGDDCGNRYVLGVAGRDGRPAESWILTGRLHATEAAAEADFEASTRLHETNLSKHMLIARPVARLAGEPRLVLYDFDPWMNLWEYLTQRRSIKSLRHSAERIAQGLAGIHRSQVAPGDKEPDPVGMGFGGMVARAETTLRSLRAGGELVHRFRALVQRVQERAAFRRRTLAPIHGAFGWDCVHYGVNGRFHLYRFENCRPSDPGLDLGGFAADLLCFTLANHDGGVYRLCRDIFLDHYNSNSEQPMDESDLQFYLALALVERLQRAESPASVAPWLDALDAAIGNRHLESEVAS